jgi:hypothetical protein
MKASGTSHGKVKQQEKIGGLHKNVGYYGFDGLAKIFGRDCIDHWFPCARTVRSWRLCQQQ